jgi:small membrane protein
MGIQIIVTVFSVFFILRAFRNFRQKNVRFFVWFFWTLLWAGMVILVWQPWLADFIAGYLKVGRGTDAILYLSLVLLFGLLFKLFVKIEALDRELTTIVRELAIIEKDAKDKNH